MGLISPSIHTAESLAADVTRDRAFLHLAPTHLLPPARHCRPQTVVYYSKQAGVQDRYWLTAVKKVGSQIGGARYVLRLWGTLEAALDLVESLRELRSGAAKWDTDMAVRQAQAISMIIYHPLEHIAWVNELAPGLLSDALAGRLERWSCGAWFVWCVLVLAQLRQKLVGLLLQAHNRRRAAAAALNDSPAATSQEPRPMARGAGAGDGLATAGGSASAATNGHAAHVAPQQTNGVHPAAPVPNGLPSRAAALGPGAGDASGVIGGATSTDALAGVNRTCADDEASAGGAAKGDGEDQPSDQDLRTQTLQTKLRMLQYGTDTILALHWSVDGGIGASEGAVGLLGLTGALVGTYLKWKGMYPSPKDDAGK
jgi:hypothetical protein